ncbi:hypothetical protein Q0590_18145 [Rhodocytophaga aerolata]|uniref:Secreted protein n=1 Tax=Rhodocytophaga aerolata TaxID=455078 RepID=A0ABT8R7X2_9BACT|nr:hypothetical protein [Rhodocytophaga aerolata]MDO1448201.1 hypothetical protein [Rhodocytophaga aerolata]
MKRLVSISLIFSLVIQTFTSVSFLTFYQFNRSIITEVFCVNKDKPALQCEGKCFITKQLTKDKQTQEQSTRGIETTAFHLFMPSSLIISLQPFTPESKAPIAFYTQQPLPSPFFSTFHPPKSIC